MKRLLVLMSSTLLAPMLLAQTTGYQDADSQNEAIGYFRSQMSAFEELQRQCVSRFPDIAPAIQSRLDSWRQREADFVSKLTYHFDIMRKQSPRESLKLEEMGKQSIAHLFSIINTTAKTNGLQSDTLERRMCLKQFEDLDAGAWRGRVPKAYAFIDALSVPH